MMFGMLKEIIVNHYNNGILQSLMESRKNSIKNMVEATISISKYELLKETIDDLSTK